MNSSSSVASFACVIASAIFLGGIVFISPDSVLAAEQGCSSQTQPEPQHSKPKFADQRTDLGDRDEIAALEAVHLALTEVGDGSSYVWHQRNGRLSGVVHPTSSFRDGGGKICRHLVISLSVPGFARSTEGIACRLANGAWQLEG